VNDEEVRAARDVVRDRFGAAVAEKASPEFCLQYGSEAELEGEEVSAVVEFAPPVLPAVAMSREELIAALRDDFYRLVEPIGGEAGATLEAAPADYCWLNRSMRISSASSSLAEVIADPAVQLVDVPLPLELELAVTTVTTGVKEYRERTGGTGKGVTVAVIDSEVRLGHPYLGDRLVQKQNFCKEEYGHPHAHGTAVAGIIGADGEGLQGVAPAATLLAYKLFPTELSPRPTDLEGALALQQALEDGVAVANCSWGIGKAGAGTNRMVRACDTAWAAGMTIVKSAGNGATMVTSPAEAEGIIVVGGTNRSGKALGSYSSFGTTPNGQPRPHLVAPGGATGDSIVSCWTDGRIGSIGGAGTSFAAPHVSGLLALILEREPDLTPAQQRDRLLGLCTPLPGVDAIKQGAGLVSAAGLT
jgi:serine protease AprX